MNRIHVVACYYCSGTGRRRLHPDHASGPCADCAGWGRLRIIYEYDEAGELTQRIEPQPDSPLPLTPKLDSMRNQHRKRYGRGAGAPPTEQ